MNGAPLRPASHYVGRWLRANSHLQLGFGFCKAKQGDKLVFSYVDVPDVAEHEFLISREDVIDVPIPAGTRVWLRGSPFGWQPGEIGSTTSANRYYVSVVGSGARLPPLHQDQFKLRWTQPLEEPVVAIANGLVEAPTFYEARSELLSELVAQRGVCRGMTAAISAPINLFQHQLDTAARVLADPVMRYLLADEVGLGKTIEAGIVIRQFLIDDPQTRVLVLSPDSLKGQWTSELRDRLGLDTAMRGTQLRVVPHSTVLSGHRSLHWLSSYDLIVIDEAHNILMQTPPKSELEHQLRNVDCLLALSATPMRGDLETFRRLLALVDPVAFGEATPETFSAQLQERERSARDIQLLSTRRASLRQKSEVLDNVETDFPADATVSLLIESCRASDDPLGPEWAELADYVREIYRLSRRMIRHRRNNDVTDSYSVAGRVPTFVEIIDPSRPVIDAFLESYRINLSDTDSAPKFAEAVRHALAGPVAVREFLGNPKSPNDRALFEMTSAQLEIAGTENRLIVAADIIADRVKRGKLVVVASTFDSVLTQLTPMLDHRIGSQRVHHHLDAMTPEERDDSVADFLSKYEGGVLLADPSIEEGRNLQESEVLVNMDIPLDINQLEQRIGRLDRYAVRPERAEIVVFTEPNSEWVSAHLELLQTGIGVFDESVSTVQRILAGIHARLLNDLLPNGVEAFKTDLVGLRDDLEFERDDIDLLEELESVEAATIFDPDVFSSLVDYESDMGPLRSAVQKLTTGTGSLALRPRESADGIVTFGGTRGIGLSADEAYALGNLLQPKAFDRSAVLGHAGVMPFRIGDPLVNWLQDYLAVDERGRASAIVRAVPGLKQPALWLRSEFLVEFDVNQLAISDEASRHRLSRRAEAHLQPMRLEFWTDPAGPPPSDLLEKELSRPFDSKRDEVLRGVVWEHVLEELPDWKQLCLNSAGAAWDEVRKSEMLSAKLNVALESAEQDTARRLAILDARALRLCAGSEWEAVQGELGLERQAVESLLAGIRNPAIRMEACGACVLWPEERF
jgi:ATP-dependent helicase HepA